MALERELDDYILHKLPVDKIPKKKYQSVYTNYFLQNKMVIGWAWMSLLLYCRS